MIILGSVYRYVLVKKLCFMESRDSSPYSQKPLMKPYPKPVESTCTSISYEFYKYYWFLSFRFCDQTLVYFGILATWPAYVLFGLVILAVDTASNNESVHIVLNCRHAHSLLSSCASWWLRLSVASSRRRFAPTMTRILSTPSRTTFETF
jgi:hypothetical protein